MSKKNGMVWIPESVLHWCRVLESDPYKAKKLNGGVNNEVYRCTSSTGMWVIKCYPPTPKGRRSRMEAEVQFLKYCTLVADGMTPRLIQTDYERQCIIMENVEGTGFTRGSPPKSSEIKEAVRLIMHLNRDHATAKAYIEMDAAEGFVRLVSHLEAVRERFESLNSEGLDEERKAIAKDLIGVIDERLKRVEDRTLLCIARGITRDAIRLEEKCVSPGDFGFHNAIRTKTGTKFIDFEFAGWDDPSKACIDFTLQPKIPVNVGSFPLLEAWDSEQKEEIRRRSKYLAPILKLKWICIILSVLNNERMEEMEAVLTGFELETLVDERMMTARRYIQAWELY